MNPIKSLLAAGLLLLVSACATVYKAEDFTTYQESHQRVAILPFASNKDDQNEGVHFQQKLYSQLLQKFSKGAYTVDFQDVDETNILLERNGVDLNTLFKHTKAELAEMLGVDAVMSGSIVHKKGQSNGAAIATQVLFGYSRTNEVTIHLTIHEGERGALIWSFDHEVAGGLGSSAEGMAMSLMKQISSKFPYRKATTKKKAA